MGTWKGSVELGRIREWGELAWSERQQKVDKIVGIRGKIGGTRHISPLLPRFDEGKEMKIEINNKEINNQKWGKNCKMLNMLKN